MTTGNLTCTTLTVSGAVTTGALTCSGLLTANAGLTVASGQTLTLTGATVAGAPTWSSSQAITLSTAAQPNVTSLGTLTGLTIGGVESINAAVGAANYLKFQQDSADKWVWYTSTGSDIKLYDSAGVADRLTINTGTGLFTINGPLSTGSNSISGGAISGTTGTFSSTLSALGLSTNASSQVIVGGTTASNVGALIFNRRDTGGNGWQIYQPSAELHWFNGSSDVVVFQVGGLAVTGTLSSSSYLGVNGAAAAAPTAGYGTPTGNSITINFPGATATLAQTTGTLAQLLLDLKRAGIILN